MGNFPACHKHSPSPQGLFFLAQNAHIASLCQAKKRAPSGSPLCWGREAQEALG